MEGNNGGALGRALRQIRSQDWWDYKIPPLLAAGYASVLVTHPPAGRALATLAALLVSISFVGAYGYLLNDSFDIEDDRRARKSNAIAGKPPWVRVCMCVGAAIGAFIPVLWLQPRAQLLGLVAVNLLLPTLYSVPPVRLKIRGIWGAFADTGAACAIPTASMMVGSAIGSAVPTALLAGGIGFAFFSGFRGIITHQVRDYDADVSAGASTFVRRLGPGVARKLVLRLIFPCEIAFAGVFLWAVLPVAPVAAAVTVAWLGVECLKLIKNWRMSLFDPADDSRERYVPLVNNEYYEVWLPLALAGQLAFTRWGFALLPLFQIFAFFPNLRARISGLAPLFARSKPRDGFEVIVGATYWTVNGVNVFSTNLVRGLNQAGIRASVLLTEEESDLVSFDERMLPRPSDIPFVRLPLRPWDGWGAHWGTLIRYLEQHAPCVYIPNSDYRHSGVAPLLSNRVVIVGIVHSDDPLHYDHVRRLGKYWNRIVAVSQAVCDRTLQECPTLAPRMATIPIGVNVPSALQERIGDPKRPLRLVYHGILKQHQKRVLDLPRIVSAALEMGIPVELSIAGSGPQEEELREAAGPLVARGAIRFLGVLNHDQLGCMLNEHDVFLLPSEFEGMPNALIEAMAHGCVPVVSRMTSGIPELVHDGENGCFAQMCDPASFAVKIGELWCDADKRRCMSQAAYDTVRSGKFSASAMVRSYIDVFKSAVEEAQQGRFVRPAGPLNAPPKEVAGISIFPVPLNHDEPGVGSFPSAGDAEDFRYHRSATTAKARPNRGSSSLRGVTVVVASPIWARNGVNVLAEDLVRGLQREGISGRLLLTEENTPLVKIDEPRLPRPTDIPMDELAVTGTDNWGRRWGAMQRYLQEHAPCIYLPNYDWRHSCVVPRLPDDVYVIGMVHAADPLYLDYVARMGESLNAVVATGPNVCGELRRRFPALSSRLETIPTGFDLPDHPPRERRLDGMLRVLVANLPCDLQALAEHARTQVNITFTCIGDSGLPDSVRTIREPSRTGWMDLFDTHDVFLTSLSDEVGTQLCREATARGCVPVLAGGLVPDFVIGDRSGFLAPPAEEKRILDLLVRIATDDNLYRTVALNGYNLATRGKGRIKSMVNDYIELFLRVREEVARGTYKRPLSSIHLPPAQVDGISVFPVPLNHEVPGLGAFPSLDDYNAYAEEVESGVSHRT